MIFMLVTFLFLLTLLVISIIANISALLLIFPEGKRFTDAIRFALAIGGTFFFTFLLIKFVALRYSMLYYYAYAAITSLSIGIIVGNRRNSDYFSTLKNNLFAKLALLLWSITGIVSMFFVSVIVEAIFKIRL